MRFFAVTIVLALAAAPANAADGDVAVDVWVSGMMKRIPFKDGVFDSAAFTSYSESYLSGLVTHYRELGENPRKRAEAAGDAFRVHEIDTRTERLIGNATRYVHDTARGMAATLDPAGTGNVKRKDAKRILSDLAGLADSDGNGVLDRYEAAIAEAAFARGTDLRKPGAEAALGREIDQASIHWN
jgi:hypothetical protein